MAEKETGLNIPVSAYADKDSAKEAVSELSKGVLSSLKDGRIEIPIELKAPIKGASKELIKAQEDVIQKLESASKKGFSSSSKESNEFLNSYNKFKKLVGQSHKNNQKQVKDLDSIIGKVAQLIRLEKKLVELNNSATRTPDIKTNKQSSKKKTAWERYTDQQEQYSKRAQGAGKRAEYNEERKQLRDSGPYLESSGNIRESGFNEHEAKLSKYSSYGSNWARELNRTLKEEAAKAMASLVTYIDKDYEIGKDNKLHGKKSGTPTTEAQMISAVYQKVKRDLTASIRQSEAGDESITANTLAQLAAIMKVLNKTLMTEIRGKSLDQAIIKTGEDIKTALNKPYDIEESDAIGFTDLKKGEQKGVGPGHENTKKIVAEFYDKLKSWDSEVFGNIKGSLSQLDETLKAVKSSDTYKAELNNLNSTMETVFGAVNDTIRETGNVNRSIKIGNTKEAVEDDQAEKISKENKDINRDIAKATKKDIETGFNTDENAKKLISVCESIKSAIEGALDVIPKSNKDSDVIKLPADSSGLYQQLPDATRLALPKPDGRRKKISDGLIPEPNIKKSLSLIPQPDIGKALAKIPGEFAKTLKESIHPSVKDKQLRIGKVQGETYIDNEQMLRDMAAKSNARKEQRKGRIDAGDKIPNVITPGEPLYSNQVQKSKVFASPIHQSIWDKFETAIEDATGATKSYKDILNATADEQDLMAAKRIKDFGINNGRNPNDTGDIASIKRALELFRTNKSSIEQNPELMQKIKLTPGVEVDTTEVTRKLNKKLSGRQMRNAQMGGSIPRQILGGLTGFIGMPSLEKSRAQADGLNQILGNINKALESVLINIQMKETELSGMEKAGQARFTKEGYITEDSSSAAKKTLADLEEEKLVLASILADMSTVDKVVDKTGGKFNKLVKQLSFTSPVLRENNAIIRNINAGLDKNGKALKFQSRTAEILNYTFQLMSRSIGQMLKNWLSQLNPITQIKKLFQDFMSYDSKWQRTMNVIKYNLRDIVRPFMEWIAQTLINIIGFLDIISMKIQEAFGYTPVSLFDQENADEFKKTYEDIQSISAGFDELHDVGSSSSENDPDNLFGEIYKPQLSQAWKDLATEIGDLFAGIITGDLGFGDVMKKILDIAWDGLQILWDWFKNTEVGKWITENWDKILATMLAAFLAWKLLKVGGSVLVKALFGGLVSGAKTVFSTIGTSLASFMKMPNLSDLNLWGAMTSAEKFAVVLKGLVGISMTVASAIMGINTAYDSTHNEKELTETEKAFNSVKSVVSDVGVGLGLFIATGNPVIALIGVLINELVKTGVEFFTTKNAIGDATEELEEWQSACEEAESAQESYREGLQQLREKEEAYGMSAENVYNLVESGKVKYEDLTAAQMDLYNSYAKVSELQNTSVQASQKATEEGLDREIAKVKENQENWQECYSKIEEAYQQGNISFAQYVDSCEELNSVLDSDNQRLFQENIPEYLEEAWNPSHYESSFQNLENAWGNICAYFDQHPLEALFDIVLSPIAKTIIGALAGFAIGGPLGAIIGGIGGAIWGVSSAINKSNSYVNDVSTYTVGEEIDEDYLKKRGRSYDIGTNYVPSDGLAYLHQGEAVIPKKYNQPYQPVMSSADQATMYQMMSTLRSLDTTMKQGISVNGQFVQRGSDLVAVVNRTNSRTGADLLSNVAYAR